MAQIDILAQQVALLTQAVNDIYANAKTTDEFPLQSPLETSSKIRVEDSAGISKHVAILDILNKASFQLTNKLLYFNGVTIVGNTVTLLAGSVWRIDNIVYSNVSNIPFTVPYVSTPGDFRKDLIVGGASNTDVIKIDGTDSDVPIEPNYPIDKVIICSLIVTDSSISVDGASVPGIQKAIERRTTAGQTVIDIGTTEPVKLMYWNGSPQEAIYWSQSGQNITLSFSTPVALNDLFQFI